MILKMELYRYSKNFWEKSYCQDSDERLKSNKVSPESLTRSEKFPIEISMDENKPVYNGCSNPQDKFKVYAGSGSYYLGEFQVSFR